MSLISEAGAFVGTRPHTVTIGPLLRGMSSLLDVGCGVNSPLRFMQYRGEKIGYDGHVDALERSKARGIHDRYLVGDVCDIDLPDDAVDVAMALEVIEHLPKDRGLPFLAELERVAKRLVVVSTPNGFLPQDTYDGNPYMAHVSGWTTDEFVERGYTVLGIAGLKELRGEYGAIAKKPAPFWWLISKFSEPWVRVNPERAFGLVAYKRLDRATTSS